MFLLPMWIFLAVVFIMDGVAIYDYCKARRREKISYEEIDGKIYKVEKLEEGGERKTPSKKSPELDENEEVKIKSLSSNWANESFATNKNFYLKGLSLPIISDGRFTKIPHEKVNAVEFKRTSLFQRYSKAPRKEKEIYIYSDRRHDVSNMVRLPSKMEIIKKRRSKKRDKQEVPDLREKLRSAVKGYVKAEDGDQLSLTRNYTRAIEEVLKESCSRKLCEDHNPVLLFENWIVGIVPDSQAKVLPLLLYRPNIYFVYLRRNFRGECHYSTYKSGGSSGGPFTDPRPSHSHTTIHCDSEEKSNKLYLYHLQNFRTIQNNSNEVYCDSQKWVLENVEYKKIKKLLYSPT